MSNYTKSTNFATKDNLTPGDPLKIVRGTEIDTEFNNIATAVATKTDNSAAAITGGTITGITDLAIADGGTGASTANAALNNLLPSQTSNANKYLQTDGTNTSWDAVSLSTADITGTLPVANGGTGVTSSTGTGSVVLSNSPTLVTPALGTPASATLTNATGLPISTGVSGLGTGVATFLATPSSANLASAVTDETGTGALVFANSPTLVTPALGTPSSGTLTNATGLPISTGVSGLGTGVATFLATPSSANLRSALTDETGSGAAVFATSPALVTPDLGTPSAATLTNATGLPVATGISGLGTGVATALAVNVGSAGAPVVNGGALGTPSSGTVTNLTGTASININGTVGATTPTTGAFTDLTTSGSVTHNGGTANGVAYLNGSKVLTTGSALTFDGSKLAINNAGEQLRLIGNGTTGYIRATDGTNNLWYIGQGGAAGLQLYTYDTNPIGFYVNASEQMRLTSTGLGIGTSSPGARLTTRAAANSYTAGAFQIESLSGTYKSYITNVGGLLLFSNSSTVDQLTLDSSGNLGLGVTPSAWNTFKVMQIGNFGAVAAVDSTSMNMLANTYYDGSFKRITTGAAGRYRIDDSHTWYTAPSGTAGNAISFTQAMSLLSSGAWVLGDTSVVASGFAGVKFNGASFNGLGLNDSSATSGAGYIYFQSNGTTIGSITRVASTSAVAYNTTSDERLKQNIQDATSASSLIDAIQVRKYDWKVDGSHQRYGFIAQELVTVVPEAVHQPADPEAMMAVDYSKLVPMLVKEIQSLRARVAALESSTLQ